MPQTTATLEVHEVVQVKPRDDGSQSWANCFAIVDDIRTWGVLATVWAHGPVPYNVRLNWDDFERLGVHAPFIDR